MRFSRPAHTYSIVAIDRREGEMGVAVQSHWFSVGSIVTWAEPGVGVVVTQSYVEASYGPLGLALMKGGKTPQQALKSLVATDPHPEVRQVAMLDARGRVAAHTGTKCQSEAGHLSGRGFSVQANLARSRKVWRAMASAFKRAKGDLAERMMAALEAGEEAGGDVRGRQSAAMLVVKTGAGSMSWQDKVIDLRVEDHAEPLKELRRLLRVRRAYAHADRGDELSARGDLAKAFEEYRRASETAPEIEELRFWHAIGLLNRGEFAKGEKMLKEVYRINKDWRIVMKDLAAKGHLKVDQVEHQRLLKL